MNEIISNNQGPFEQDKEGRIMPTLRNDDIYEKIIEKCNEDMKCVAKELGNE